MTKPAVDKYLGAVKRVRLYWSDVPVGPVIITIDIPGRQSKYLVCEVTIWFWTMAFTICAVV